jgi:hypothetical protein
MPCFISHSSKAVNAPAVLPQGAPLSMLMRSGRP